VARVVQADRVLKKFLRFGVLSGGGWLLDCGLLLLLHRAGFALFGANFLSSATAALSVYLLSRRWVFKPDQSSAVGSSFLYLMHTAVMITLASLAMPWAAKVAQWALPWWGTLPTEAWVAFVAKVLVTPPQLVLNFFMARHLAR
jgi:putative flippase GtrA